MTENKRPSPPWPWLLFAGAALIRLWYISQGYPVPPQDTPDYDELAHNLLAGEGFVSRQIWYGFEMRSWRAPFYPFFLALVYGLWGYSHLAVKVVQAFIGAFTAVLVYALGRRVHPEAALPAGLAATAYGPLVASANEVMTETWFTAWVVLAAYWLVQSASASTWGRLPCLAGGLAIGLAALTRPVGLLLVPAFICTVAIIRPPRFLYRIAWLGLGVGLALAPWTLRNYQVHGVWMPISSHGGFILARSNAADPDWRRPGGWGIERRIFEAMPSEVERDRYWLSQAGDFIRTHPGIYLRLAGERFLRFWYFMQPGFNFWFATLLPLALGGFYWYWRRSGFLLPSSFICISVGVFSLLLYGSTRFRLPLEPFALLFAAAFAVEGHKRWGRRLWLAALTLVALNGLIYWQDDRLHGLLVDLLHYLDLK
ncbi:MAG: hypothetical protein GKR89_19370 [Candidatus Latescibacteria bacterium]|nr:hypothetical protein [Candidatus Latescibacterota bacterium]